MCNKSKRKKPPLPKFIAYLHDIDEPTFGKGQTAEEALENLQSDYGVESLKGVVVFEVARAGKASITIEWEEEKK